MPRMIKRIPYKKSADGHTYIAGDRPKGNKENVHYDSDVTNALGMKVNKAANKYKWSK